MTGSDASLPHQSGRADLLRESIEEMARAVRLAADQTWTGPFADVTDRLVELGRVDLCLARLVEGHADAMRILDQAGVEPHPGAYGVWASRSAGTGARAERAGGRWRVFGEVRFASGADIIDRALVPGWVDEHTHRLFDVSLEHARPDRSTWHTSAMDAARSFTVDLDASGVDPVGADDFYLRRSGFVVGGLQVAAVWAGGVAAVVDLVTEGLRHFSPTPHQLRRLGVMEQAAWAAHTALARAVAGVGEQADDDPPVADITHARSAVVAAADLVIDEAGRIVGPGGLAGNARLARTLADLGVYVRQHHLDLTFAALGQATLDHRSVSG